MHMYKLVLLCNIHNIAVRADVRERNGEKGEGEEDENQMFLLQVIIAPTCFGHKVGIL